MEKAPVPGVLTVVPVVAEHEVAVPCHKDFQGTMVVQVPRPDFLPSGDARLLQAGAAAGVRQWNGQPFPITVDERGNREAHFEVQWRSSLGGRRQIGVARTQWSAQGGLGVIMLELATQNPFAQKRDARSPSSATYRSARDEPRPWYSHAQ